MFIPRLVISTLLLLAGGFFSSLPAQILKRTAVTSYSVEDGLLQNSVANVVVDTFGFAWFSTGAGIQRFDGHNFETIPFEPEAGLAFRSANLFLLQTGAIWVCNTNGIAAFNPATNRFRPIYRQAPSTPGFFYEYAGEDAGSVWVLDYPVALLQFDKRSGALLQKQRLPASLAPEQPLETNVFCKPMGEGNIAICINKTLLVYSTTKKKFIIRHKTSSYITGFVALNAQTLLYTQQGAYYRVDVGTAQIKKIAQAADGATPESAVQLLRTPEGRLLAGYNQNVYELDTVTLKIKVKWSAFNQNNLLNSGFITNLYLDRFQRLWILSNSDGVKRFPLNRLPFDYYGATKREWNFIRSIFLDKEKGLLLAGTYNQGLLLFDTSGFLLRQIPLKAGIAATVLNIFPLGKDDYLLLVMGDTAFYRFNIKTSTARPLYINLAPKDLLHCSYYGSLHQVGKASFVFSDHHLFYFRLVDGKLTDTASLLPIISNLYEFCPLSEGGYLAASANGLVFMDPSFRQKKAVSFAYPIFPRCLAQDLTENLWIGTENGLYKMDKEGRLQKKFTAADGLPDEGIYAIEPVAGGIYFSHNKGLSFLSNEGRFEHYTRQSGLQENEFNTKSSFQTPEGKVFFGGINGITAFYPHLLNRREQRMPVSITSLLVMGHSWKDTAVWNIQQVRLDYNTAHLALRIGTPSASDNGGQMFAYKMEGQDPNWNTTTGTDYIRYSLQPGSYLFRVRITGSQHALDSETRLQVVVAAPYWQQGWFRAAMGAAVLVLLASAIHRYNRSRYLKKIRQLELERQLQRERERISRDLHDNLGAYASAITANVEKITAGPGDGDRLKSIKENSREIMHNLRDTIWALNKNQIDSLAFSDRLKAFVQKMREAFPAVTISLEENVDPNVQLSPEVALNVLRIIQEAVHNAMRHSGGSAIMLTVHLGRHLHITICDNGTGLLQQPGKDANGLQNMHTRAREAGLQIQIRTVKATGTQVELFSLLQ